MQPNVLSVLIFDGKSSIISKGLSRLLDGASHVALAIPAGVVAGVSQRLGKPDVFRGWYVLESTTENTCEDVITNKKIKGVSIVPFDKRVSEYRGTVSMRRLENIPGCHPRYQQWYNSYELIDVIAEYHGRPYERSPGRLLGSWIDRINIFNRNNDNSIFCSELNILVYQRLGIIEKRSPAEETHPGDFIRNPNGHIMSVDGNQLTQGYALGPMIRIGGRG